MKSVNKCVNHTYAIRISQASNQPRPRKLNIACYNRVSLIAGAADQFVVV